MSSTDKKNPLAGVDVESIIKTSLSKERALHLSAGVRPPKELAVPEQITESYVAEPKAYSQVTEFVSQKTKEAHTAIYQGYVDTLNRVSAELDTVPRGEADSKHSAYRGLRLDETYNLNSVWLHELYFANCFDPHSEVYMDSMAYLRLERDFGTFEDWQKDFMACGMACGSGWAVCGYNIFLKRYIVTMVSNHSQDVMLGLYPLVVIDMHEHAYFKDYQTDKKSYMIAMMRELNWGVIEERFKKAESLHEVMK
jgi:Fe-Mn family superoxide dismutase